MNHMIIDGLAKIGTRETKQLALKLANSWISNCYWKFVETKCMHEKYDCRAFGSGGGGEYEEQIGFGWSNGVVLDLMHMFGDKLTLLEQEQK